MKPTKGSEIQQKNQSIRLGFQKKIKLKIEHMKNSIILISAAWQSCNHQG